MNQKLDVQFSLGSWVYVGGLMGFCGGVVLSLISAAWSLIEGNFIEAVAGIIIGPVCGLLTIALYAALGYFIYNWLASRYPNGRILSGTFKPLDSSDA